LSSFEQLETDGHPLAGVNELGADAPHQLNTVLLHLIVPTIVDRHVTAVRSATGSCARTDAKVTMYGLTRFSLSLSENDMRSGRKRLRVNAPLKAREVLQVNGLQ